MLRINDYVSSLVRMGFGAEQGNAEGYVLHVPLTTLLVAGLSIIKNALVCALSVMATDGHMKKPTVVYGDLGAEQVDRIHSIGVSSCRSLVQHNNKVHD